MGTSREKHLNSPPAFLYVRPVLNFDQISCHYKILHKGSWADRFSSPGRPVKRKPGCTHHGPTRKPDQPGLARQATQRQAWRCFSTSRVKNVSTPAKTRSAGTSPQRCATWSGFVRACAAMIPACTTLDHTVNQIRLKFVSGSRLAINRKTPSVA